MSTQKGALGLSYTLFELLSVNTHTLVLELLGNTLVTNIQVTSHLWSFGHTWCQHYSG